MVEDKKLLALLIDAENIPHTRLSEVLNATSQHGSPAIRRVYGDFSKPQMKAWSKEAEANGLVERYVAVRTTGKNAVDMAIAIDAMELASEGRLDGFVLATSDADFTELALRLREREFFILGVGENKAPPAFVNACSAFVRLGATKAPVAKQEAQPQIKAAAKSEPEPEAPKTVAKKAAPASPQVDSQTAMLVRAILGGLVTDEWMPLSQIGEELRKRNYKGKTQLTKVLKRLDDVELQATCGHTSARLKKAG